MGDAESIALWLKRHPNPGIEHVFGGATAEVVETFVAETARALLGATLTSADYHAGQVVTVCVKTDVGPGAAFAMKIYPTGYENTEVLRATRAVQAHLAASGLPVPVPIRLEPVGSAIVAIDEFRGGERKGWDTDGALTDMAHRYAALMAEMPSVDGLPELRRSRLAQAPRPPTGYETPPALGRELQRCLAMLDGFEEPPAIAHLDWRLQNLAWRGEALSAIYDWDSVAVSTESRAVGAAAGMWSYDFRDAVPHVPTPAEVAEFITDYGRVRAIDVRIASAAAGVKMLGYAATEQHLDPGGTRLGPRSYRTKLADSLSEYSDAFRP